MPLIACRECACFHRAADPVCPHCGSRPTARLSTVAMALLAGLALTGGAGCPQPLYGISVKPSHDQVDQDDDGFTKGEGDCDDTDDTINPDAEETPGDDIDSNCDGEDDT